MSCEGIGTHSFCVKKGSRTPTTWVFYTDRTKTVKYSLSAYDTAELLAYDKRGGTLLFTETGTITQGTSTIEMIISKANTSSLVNDGAFYNFKLSASGDSTLDWIPVEGFIDFID